MSNSEENVISKKQRALRVLDLIRDANGQLIHYVLDAISGALGNDRQFKSIRKLILDHHNDSFRTLRKELQEEMSISTLDQLVK